MLRDRIARLGDEPLLRNGLYIMGVTAIPSVLGFAFWVIAARALPTVEVGRAASLVSAMLLVSLGTNLGVGQVFVSRLPARAAGHEWSITVTVGLLVLTVASLVGGALAALLIPLLIPSLSTGVSVVAWFVLPLGVTAAACSLALDHACIAERQARPAFVRNATAAIVRIALIGAAGAVPIDGTAWVLILWTFSFLLIDALGIARVLPSLGHEFRLTLAGWRAEMTAIRRLIAGHHSINLGAQAATYLLPLIVAARLGPSQSAFFYTTFLLANALFFVAPAIGDSLFAEGAHHPRELNRIVRRSVRYTVALAAPPAVVLVLAGHWILALFGPEYADAATSLLRVLVLAAVFAAGLALSVAVLRVRAQLMQGAVATFAMLVIGIACTWFLLPPLGLVGAGVGWGTGQACGMLVGVLLVSRGRSAATSSPP